MAGHGIIINLSSLLPFVFQFNPESVDSEKTINYVDLPNIGGSSHERVFSGFENKSVSFQVMLIDKDNPIGVVQKLAFLKL